MVSALMRGQPRVANRVAGLSREDVQISQVTVAEIEFGLRSLPASKRRRALEAQWSAIGPELIRLPWSDELSRLFGERKARLARAGRQSSDFDLAIAVHALVHGLTLVTADRDFDRVKVRRENWLV
jgi:predicted nucleic acid-binding protein